MSIETELYPWFLSGIGGALGAVLLLPTKAGEALLQFKTSKLLEEFKAERGRELEQFKAASSREIERLKADQGHELERLKERLNHLGDRGRRSNEMEFNAIETVWKGFVKAWLSTNTCVQAMIPLPDIEMMPDDDLKKLAASAEFSEREQSALLKSSDRKEEYVRTVKWKDIIHAERDIYQARLILREQRIFMPPDLTKRFGDVIERMSAVQIEQKLAAQHCLNWQHRTDSAAWAREKVQIFEDVAVRANQRLFRDELNPTRNSSRVGNSA